MNKNEKFVITLNRELGSGGRTVGRKVAEKLGVQFYDKAIIKTLTEKFQLSEDAIEQMKGQSHHWWHDFKFAGGIGMGMIPTQFSEAYGGELGEPTSAMMFRIEKELLEGIAADLRKVAALPSPLGRILDERTLPNGLHLRKVRVPFGVIGVIIRVCGKSQMQEH